MADKFRLDRNMRPSKIYNIAAEGQVFELDPSALKQNGNFYFLPDPNAKETDSIKYVARFVKVQQ
jgi:hypothetical protein